MKNVLVRALAILGTVSLLFGVSLAPASAAVATHPDIPGLCWVYSGGGYLGASCPNFTPVVPVVPALPTVPVVPTPVEPIFTEVPPVVTTPVQTVPAPTTPVVETKAQKENRKAAEKAAKNLAKSLRNK